MTYRKLLKEITIQLKEANIETADLDARVLIKHVLRISDTDLYKNFDQAVNKKAVSKIQELAVRRAKGEPIAYLTKNKEFFGLNFYVNENVLIPRPESEWLVEESIKYLETTVEYKTKLPNTKYQILDMGTGSGNILISLIRHLKTEKWEPETEAFATDISPAALKVAIHNAKQNGIASKINFLESDLFSNKELPKKFDLIIANLPYVPKNNETIEQLSNEPFNAIFAADNGAEIIKKFLVESKGYLIKNGLILLELDPRNAEDIKSFAKKIYPQAKTELTKDLAGLERYLTIQSNQV